MSAYIKTVLSKEIKACIAAAAKAVDQERAREAEEARLRASVERNLAERALKAQDYAQEVLAELNQKNLAKLEGLTLETVPQIATKASSAAAPQAAASSHSFKVNQTAIYLIIGLYEELKELNGPAAAAKAPLLTELKGPVTQARLDLVLDSFKVALAKEITLSARTALYRRELEETLSLLKELSAKDPRESREFEAKVLALMGQKVIVEESMILVRDELQTLLEKEAKAVDQELLQKALKIVQKQLSKAGYEVQGHNGLALGQNALFSAGDPDYVIQGRLDAAGELTFQQLKVAANRDEAQRDLSDIELAVDKERAQIFCAVHEKLVSELANAGIDLKTVALTPPGEKRLPVLVNPHKAQAGDQKTAKSRRNTA
ncbi:MAG: hypothetical protein LBS60_12830 [Deltaproteobacteria bacterium]|jgi:hypothetical protein|nr:hypothetical protein [Deltaproteobacteria bacterium]